MSDDHPASHPAPGSPAVGPAWASALGVVAIVLGVFLTAYHGNEWMKQTVLVAEMPASGVMPEPDCPEDELEEEGISLGECEYMVTHVGGIALSTPDWFPRVQGLLALAGVVVAFVSILVGGALVNYSPAAATLAVPVFLALAAIDAAQFGAVVNTGPILRDLYLWPTLLWLFIHLMMTCAALAGRVGDTGTTVGRSR